MDVRAPIEHAHATLPNSKLVPLLDDHQRETIGIEYAQAGQDSAIELGQLLATDEIKQQRLRAWRSFIAQNPDGYLYCFRGGLRSRITQLWLGESGISYPMVVGGYKAVRSYLLDTLNQLCERGNILVVSGSTGSGKTEFLKLHQSSVDLEGLACHRGSAFGGTFIDQPSQSSWENTMIAQWLKCSVRSSQPVLFEAESHLIGRISLPVALQDLLARAPILMLEVPFSERVKRIKNDYINFALQHFKAVNTEDPVSCLESYMASNLERIKRRLGGERHAMLRYLLPAAINEVRAGDVNLPTFDIIVATLLKDYYDPLYQHKFSSRESRILARGNATQLMGWLQRNPKRVV